MVAFDSIRTIIKVLCGDESILDKIRTEIEEYKSRQSSLVTGVDDLESTGIAYVKGKQVTLEYVLAIFDKYKAESEE